MIYRRFGRTELSMPVITCGGMRYQQSWQDVELSEVEAANQANLEACIRAALAAGINHIETARGYGSSERQLGQILPTLPRDEMIIQTKVGPADTGEGFLAGFNTSMDRLKLDYVDLLAIHGINNRSLLEMTLKPGGSLDMALELKKQGRCRHVGFSTHGPTDVIVDACEIQAAARGAVAQREAFVAQYTDPERAEVREPAVDARVVLVVAGDEEHAVLRAQLRERRDERAELVDRAVHEIASDHDRVGDHRVDRADELLDEIRADRGADVHVGDLRDDVARQILRELRDRHAHPLDGDP